MADTNLLILAREFKKLRTHVQEVLKMPVGPQGLQGETGEQGVKGDTGAPGKDGKDGKDGVNGLNGQDGRNGVDGNDGKDGLDGVGVQNAYIDFDNSLVIVLTSGQEINAGFLSQETKDAVVATFKQGAQTLNELLPVQTGNANKFLKTDGENVSWDTLDGSDINLASPPVIGSTTPNAATFTTVTIPAASGNAVILPNTSITSWLYSGNSFSTAGQEVTPNGLFIGSSGTKMYVNGSSGDDVNEYTLGTAWDITTATFVTTFSTSAQDITPIDIFFSPDGLSMFIMGNSSDTVYQYTLGTAWSVATASYASKSFSVNAQESTPTGVWFKSDGTAMYVVGTSADTVFQYALSTAWDVSTASYGGVFYSIAAQETSANQVNLSGDGLKMWVVGSAGDDIWEYDLGTAWNVSTATPVNNFYIGFQAVNPSGLFIDNSAANRVFVLDSTADAVFQYNTATNSAEFNTDKLYTPGALSVNGNFVAGANAYVDGTLVVQGAGTIASLSVGTTTVSGTLSASSTITLTGATTSTTSLGTGASTGTLTLGGTGQTGAMTIGQSTVSQTTNIQAGATASGSTKTLAIGTGGLSGSTTNINIGSAVSGATSTTTLNGLVIDSISAAVSAAGATQATATALVANINNVTVVAAAADGVRLPTAVAGMRILVRNSDALDTLKIYPATGGQINALGANTASTLVAGLTVELMATTATQWFTF
jgi:hypothetical protein